MVNVDDNSRVAMEIVTQGTQITEELILKILKKLNDLLSKDNKEKYILKDTSKEGKQKINDLVKKHKDGVLALDENITKQQLKDYQEELKKLGVDFSVVKNEKDSYSFFFASQHASIIEKALKNIVERKNNVLENEQVKKLEVDLKKDRPQEKVKKEPKENKVEFSMNGVKEIDKKIREKSKEQDKSRNKKQVVER